MTEKRFKQLTGKGFTYAFIDTENLDMSYLCDNEIDCKNIVDLLNELNDKNEQLQSELNECNRIKTKRTKRMKNQRKALNDMQEALWGYKGDIKSLKRENEQLKKELFETSKELLWATSDEVDRVLYYEEEVEELRKEIFE